MKADRFFLACLRDTVGSNVSFHCKNGRGYSTALHLAHEYTREQAQSAWDRGRDFDMPLNADMVEELSVFHVDCQYLPTETVIEDECREYVAFEKGKWNGNDVYWITNKGLPTCDFNKAAVFDAPGDDDQLVWVPLHMACKVRRRTFCIDLINRRRMIQASGLITPDHVKRSRRRKNSSGKTRWNCPACGKISWQYNPYDFEGCNDIYCKEAA